jgi:hypothetical protein
MRGWKKISKIEEGCKKARMIPEVYETSGIRNPATMAIYPSA